MPQIALQHRSSCPAPADGMHVSLRPTKASAGWDHNKWCSFQTPEHRPWLSLLSNAWCIERCGVYVAADCLKRFIFGFSYRNPVLLFHPLFNGLLEACILELTAPLPTAFLYCISYFETM